MPCSLVVDSAINLALYAAVLLDCLSLLVCLVPTLQAGPPAPEEVAEEEGRAGVSFTWLQSNYL